MQRVRKRAKVADQWGEYEILVLPYADGWLAAAYHDNKRVYASGSLQSPTKKAALAALRKRMREVFNYIPQRVDQLEALHERLRKALLR